MKYAFQKSSGAMMYIPSFIKTGSVIQKLMWGHTNANTQTAWRSQKLTSGT
jgi:hypothetical protein